MTPLNLAQWAQRHGVTPAALAELAHLAGAVTEASDPTTGGSEAQAAALVRLEAAQKGVRLWRNNVGALRDERGVPVRYGLANDSKALNDRIKSSDLIGWRRRLIGPQDVGRTIAQFVCREIKKPGWRYAGTPREVAQKAWIDLVLAEGGDAAFTTGAGSL